MKDVHYEYLLSVPSSSDSDSEFTASFHQITPTSNYVETRKYIVFESQLDELFKHCSTCGVPVSEQEKTEKGTMLTIKTLCLNGHANIWNSQPVIKGVPVGNLLIPAAVLHSGNTYTHLNSFATILNLKFVSEKHFYRTQGKYLFQVVNTCWKEQQKEILSNLKLEKAINVCGDGRYDSPGHSTKYGTYTLLDESTKKVIAFSLVQVSEVSSSNAMEYEGCKRSLDKILGENIPIRCLTTDRHTTITAKMKTEYPEIVRQCYVRHLSKSIVKKLTKKAKKKFNQELSLWIKSTSNHLWWSVATCNGDANLLREKWISIVYHAANRHRWAGCKKFKKCAHHPVSRKEKKSVQWLKPGSPVHVALEEVVTNSKILKDLEKLTEFHHMGELEEYHSVKLKYAQKREHFSYRDMLARLQLVALDRNYNCNRQQSVIKCGKNKGTLRCKVECPKRSNEWVATPIKVKKTNEQKKQLMKMVLDVKQSHITEVVDVPCLPRNISKKTKPNKDDVIKKTHLEDE